MNTGNEKYIVIVRSEQFEELKTPQLVQNGAGNHVFTLSEAWEVVRVLVDDVGYPNEDYTILELKEVDSSFQKKGE